MNKPLVSIHVITYNQINFIRETLDSVFSQDYDNLEVVVSDDGSSDGTEDIILEYANKYGSKLVPVVGQVNLGITGNCNRALKYCTGRYVALLGGDDIFYPGKISKQVEWMEADSDRVLCGHDVNVFESSSGKSIGIKRQRMPKRNGVGASSIIEYGPASFFAGTSLMIRRNVIPEYGFDVRFPIAADWKFMIDCLANGGEYGAIDGIYAGYRKHGNSITDTSLIRILQETLVSIGYMEVDYPQYIFELHEVRKLIMYKLGIHLLKSGEIPRGMMYLRGARYFSWYQMWGWPLLYILSKQTPESMQEIRSFYRNFKKILLRNRASY